MRGNYNYVTCVCERCGTTFERFPSQVARFCSPECRNDHLWRERSRLVPCVVCGTEFRVYPCDAERHRCCSVACGRIAQRAERTTVRGGYILIWTPDGRHMKEHRWNMEQHLGRPLRRNEYVHHINGNTQDNGVENLVILSPSDHTRLHKVGDLSRWSRDHEACRECGTTQQKHKGDGLCTRCHRTRRYQRTGR